MNMDLRKAEKILAVKDEESKKMSIEVEGLKEQHLAD